MVGFCPPKVGVMFTTPGRLQATKTPPHYKGCNMNAIVNEKGIVVGKLESYGGELWLVKRKLDPSKHQLKEPPAWATSVEHIRLLTEQGGAGVRIHDTTGAIWEASLSKFLLHGFDIYRKHGKQIGLRLTHWKRYIGKQLEMEI